MSTVGNAASLVRIPAPGPLLAVPPAGAEARRLAARTALASSAGARVPSWGTRCGRSPGAPRSARRSSLAASTVRANQGWITSRHAWGSSDVGSGRSPHGGARAVSREPLPEVVTDPERVRHDGERRVHGTARGQEAPVDDVEVVDVVGLAVVPHRVAPVSRGDVEVTETARLLAVPTRSASPTTAVMSV